MNLSPNGIQDFQEEDSLDLKREITRYLRYWPWFILAMLVTVISAYMFLRYAPKIYETSAKIKILDETEGLELPTSAFIFKRVNINLENEIEILTSYRIIETVVRDLKLNTTFFQEGSIQTRQIANLPFKFEQTIAADSIIYPYTYHVTVNSESLDILNKSTESNFVFENHDSYLKEHNLPFQIQIEDKSSIESLIGEKFVVKFTPIKKAVLRLKSGLKVEAIGEQSDLLKLSKKGESTLWSEYILNALVEAFNQDGINDRQLVSKRTLDFIDDRFIFLAQELDSIEIDRKDFKQDNNLIDLETNAGIDLMQRSQSDNELFQVENQIALADLLKDALGTVNTEVGLLPSDIGINNASLNVLIQEYNAAVLQQNKLVTSGGVNNPSVKIVDTQINNLRRNLSQSIFSYAAQLKVSRQQLEKRNQKFSGKVSSLPRKEKLLRAIERQQKIKESLYLLLLQKREEAAINLAITEPSVKIVEYALSGSNPISPNSRIIYIGAMFAGLLIPFGFLYLIFMLDTKLHSKEDVKSIARKIPIIGEIPSIKTQGATMFIDPNDRSDMSESFRILSANVNYIIPQKKDKTAKVVFCTSTIKGEGKTYISINLSLALSSLNKKVLLIGADLRNPQIHTHINHDKKENGLTNYLHDSNIQWKDMIINGFEKHTNHHTIISGPIPPNPAHLLTNGRFEQLMEEAKLEYDYIIVDTAPAILVTDTMLISKLADATVYIARANFTEKNLLNFSKELNESGKLKNMAYVLNDVGASKSYGYSYNYGYGYGYGVNK